MTAGEAQPALEERGERWIAALVLALLAGLVLWRAPAYLGGEEPLGADSSSHILTSATLAEHLRAGSPGWWMPHLNAGFPIGHYYQPLPHLATAILSLALGGPEQAALAYKLWVVALLCLLPVSMYAGLRRLELSRAAALTGAIALATLSTREEVFGLTVRHYLFVGLYTMLWGCLFLPLALAEGVRFVQGRGRASLAVASFGLLFLSHGLLALGLVPLYALVVLLVPRTGGPALLGRGLRLVQLGAASGLLIAAWLLPQLACSDYFNGWPIPMGKQTLDADGFGLAALLGEWVRGSLMDLKRGPVLTALSLLGALVAVARARRPYGERVVLLGLVLFLVFTAGRRTFGSVLDWVFPPNTRIEGMMRWVAMLHLFLAAAAGLGGELLAGLVRRIPACSGRGWIALVLVSSLTLGLALPRHVQLLGLGLTTFGDSPDRPAYTRIAEALAAEPVDGRVYTREELGHSTHWAMAYLTVLTGKPMTLSYGVGGQDSLDFYYLWYLDVLDPERGPALVRLFDIRYLLVRPGLPLGGLQADFVARAGPYEVQRLRGEYGLFELIDAPEVVDLGSPAEMRGTCKRWMLEQYPRGARFLRLPEPLHVELPSLPGENRAPVGGGGGPASVSAPPARAIRGEILAEQTGLARFETRLRLDDEQGWLVLKVTPHPFWEAEIDGRPAPLFCLSPAFMGLPLEPGEHDVVFTFRAPGWQKVLLYLAPLWLGLLIALDQRTRLRERCALAAG